MLEPPPAIIMPMPDVPPGFSIDQIERSTIDVKAGGGCRASASSASNESEIIVCGRRDPDRDRLGPALGEAPTGMDEINDSLSVTLGPLEIGSFKDGSGHRRFGIRTRF